MDSAAWQKAKNLIVEALELPGSEREAFVRDRCADPAVCAEILEMLQEVRTRDDFLASRQIDAASVRLVDDDDALQIGTKVGPYLVVDRIGRGGMGQVFLGTDPRLERRVALKCLLDSQATGPGVRSGILHEARAAARINNQHIAAVYDVIEHDTRAFIVMEYVEGESLAARLRRGRLSVRETLVFGQQLVLALTAAHAQNIVHRDLKPGNIQVTPAGSVKVLDFGIAHATRRLTTAPAPSTASTTNPSAEGPQAVPFAQPGTPPYMSPEQLLGRHVDERSDIYSLGVVLFEMCTGQRPFSGNDAAEIASAQMKGVPRADAVTHDTPRPLADLVARAMATDVAKRYQSAQDVGVALDGVRQALNRDPVDWRELFRRWIPRVAIGTPIVVLAMGALGFLTSVQFNFVFGLDGEFARFGVEPWRNYFQYGLLATAPMLVPTVLVGVPFVGVRFMLGLLTLISPIGRFARRIRAGAERAEAAMGLDRSATLAQGLMVLGVLSLALFVWAHADLIRAWSSFFNSAPIEQLMPMTDSAPERNRYHNELSIATLALSFGLYRVMVIRRREKVHDGRFGVAMLATVIAVMVLLNVLPWRTFHRRDFERLDSAGAHCYITGESGDELMVLCPGGDPPRNRVVRKDAVVESVQSENDPLWHRPGRKENVFKGIPFGFVR